MNRGAQSPFGPRGLQLAGWAVVWFGATTSEAFNLNVAAATPPDVYTLTFHASGLDTSRWTQSEEVLVNVVPLPEPAGLAALAGAMTLLGLRGHRCRLPSLPRPA